MSITQLLKAQAFGLGFDLVGVARLGPAETGPMFEAWLEAGHAGEMGWLERGRELRLDSRRPVAGATSAWWSR
jgi:epoxyqueuosine reductase